MSSLYDTTMKREKMVVDFKNLLLGFRTYFEEADIPLDGNPADYPELTLYNEASRIYGKLPHMYKLDDLCILEGEYDLLTSILADMKNGDWITSPYYNKKVV